MSKILAIETSCDETAIAILECVGSVEGAEFKVLGNALYSQIPVHAPYGGVYPMLAKREHIKNLPILLEKALAEAGLGESGAGIDLIAVTHGPGLEPALWTGITFAEELGKKWSVPVAGVNHLEGHIISALLGKSETGWTLPTVKLPLLALLVSGGHTQLVFMPAWFTYELVGETRDDAVGEAFDKVARLLELSYPGGPQIATLAARGREKRGEGKNPIEFPRPMATDATCDFSFSGLKTAVLYKLRTMEKLSDTDKENIAEAFEDAARDVISIKTRKAIRQTSPATVVAGGGVSANIEMRNALARLIGEEFPDIALSFPHAELTGDNAIMIAAAGYLHHTAGRSHAGPLTASGKLELS